MLPLQCTAIIRAFNTHFSNKDKLKINYYPFIVITIALNTIIGITFLEHRFLFHQINTFQVRSQSCLLQGSRNNTHTRIHTNKVDAIPTQLSLLLLAFGIIERLGKYYVFKRLNNGGTFQRFDREIINLNVKSIVKLIRR